MYKTNIYYICISNSLQIKKEKVLVPCPDGLMAILCLILPPSTLTLARSEPVRSDVFSIPPLIRTGPNRSFYHGMYLGSFVATMTLDNNLIYTGAYITFHSFIWPTFLLFSKLTWSLNYFIQICCPINQSIIDLK